MVDRIDGLEDSGATSGAEDTDPQHDRGADSLVKSGTDDQDIPLGEDVLEASHFTKFIIIFIS